MKASLVAAMAFGLAGSAVASFVVPVDYSYNSGQNANARASTVWSLNGTTLTIEMHNTSIFNASTFAAGGGWSLSSINFALPSSSLFNMAGAKSVSESGSTAFGQNLNPGNQYTGTAAQNWLFQNGGPSGDTPNYLAYKQVISTLQGDTNANALRYSPAQSGNPTRPQLSGPAGGIFPTAGSAGGLYGWASKLTFTNTLTASMTETEFRAVVSGSAITFNSHGTFLTSIPFLTAIPLPTSGLMSLAGLGFVAIHRRR